MIYIKKFESLEEYSGLYVTPIELDKTYNRFINTYSSNIKQSIYDLCNYINNKYELVVNMNINIQPGLITNSTNIENISKDIYDFLNQREIDSRIVYGYGNVDTLSNDIHKCYGSLLIKIGRKTDELKGKKGIFSC